MQMENNQGMLCCFFRVNPRARNEGGHPSLSQMQTFRKTINTFMVRLQNILPSQGMSTTRKALLFLKR